MQKTGRLRVTSNVSRLEEWRRLARDGEDSPLGAATDFLAEKGLDEGDTIRVTGSLGSLDDGTAVCFITDAVLAPAAAKAGKASGKSARTNKKRITEGAAAGGGRAGAKRATKKTAAKKNGAKDSGAKKSGAGKKSSAKKKSAVNRAAPKRPSKKSPAK